MSRWVVSLVAVAACAVGIVGCAGKQDTSEEKKSSSPEGTTKTTKEGDKTRAEREQRDYEVRTEHASHEAGKPTDPSEEICARNCRAFEYCISNWPGSRQACIEGCLDNKEGPCGEPFVTFLKCTLGQSCQVWAEADGGTMPGCRKQYRKATKCARKQRNDQN